MSLCSTIIVLLLLSFTNTEPPDSPNSVVLEVIGDQCLRLKFNAPMSIEPNKSIVTKYKGQSAQYNIIDQGWLKSAILGGSSYKEINPVIEMAQNRI